MEKETKKAVKTAKEGLVSVFGFMKGKALEAKAFLEKKETQDKIKSTAHQGVSLARRALQKLEDKLK